MTDSKSSNSSFLHRRTPWSRRRNANVPALQEDEEFLLTRSALNLIEDTTSSIDNKLTSDKTSLSGQSLDPHDDIGSHGGTLPCGDGSASIQYCRSCQLARAASGYAERVARLMDRLYCAACKCEHHAIPFSLSSRQNSSSSRACIAHEGHLSVCLHLKLSLEDIRSLRTMGKSVDLDCEEGACPCPGAKIKYFVFDYSPMHDFVSIGWTASPDHPNTSSSFMHQCISTTSQLHALWSSLFCPAFDTTPDRLFQPDQFTDFALATEPPRLKCLCSCGFGVHYDQETNMVNAECLLHLSDSRDNPRPLDWIEMLDPRQLRPLRGS
ncbi:hypothetical protein DER44DRAFT_748128 [Fusarium oxysporum]|nr:hypothetical protein DER44DRAFT_748128 [Fusarium oxysporum]